MEGGPAASDALGNLVTYQYDAASRRVLRIDGRGLLTSYVYDAASRLTGQQYQDGTRATMTYDADSRRTVLSDWTGLYTSAYDQDSRLSSVVNPAGIAITYAYDAVGQRATMARADGYVHLRLRPGRPYQQSDEPRSPSDELVIRREQPGYRPALSQRRTSVQHATTMPIAS